MSGYRTRASSSASPDYPTPQRLFELAEAEFGPFDLDPAADPENAKAAVFYTAEDDGLSQPWPGRVWCNPPWGWTTIGPRPRHVGRWVDKAVEETRSGRADLVVMVLRAATGTPWYHRSREAAALVREWPVRIKWDGKSDSHHGTAVLVFGRLTGRHGTEAARCAVCKGWFWPARKDAATCSPACRQKRYRVADSARKRNGGR